MKLSKLAFGIVSVVIGMGAGSAAFASHKLDGNSEINWQDNVQSTKTRAEVIAELKQARKDGQLNAGGQTGYPPEQARTTNRTRVEVQAEAVRATKERRAGIDGLYFGG